MAAAATKNLTYTLTVPADVSPGVTYTNKVGVVEWAYIANNGTAYQLIPANTTVKDPSLPAANMPAAEATESIHTRDAGVVKGRSTSVNESGNNAGSQATIGEVVTYTVITTIPKNTTVYGAKVTDPLGSRQTLVPGSLCVNGCTLDGAAFGGVTESPANTVLATLPSTYAAPVATDGVLVITFQAKVLDVAANTRGTLLGNTATLTYLDQDETSHTKSGATNTTIVEPKVSIAKAVAGLSVVTSGETKSFTVTASNSNATSVSPAHDVVVVDTVPAGTEPVTINQGGVWDATARTITWTKATTSALGAIAPGASVALTYTVQVENPAVGGTTYTNTVKANTTSLGSDTTGVRSSTSSSTTAPDYTASANKMISVVLPTITKAVTPTEATIGDNVTWTVKVKVPANVRYWDTTVVDTVPDGLAVDSYGAITCTAGCPGTDPTVSTFPVTASGATQQAAWFLGDLAPAAEQRTYELVLNGHVLVHEAGRGQRHRTGLVHQPGRGAHQPHRHHGRDSDQRAGVVLRHRRPGQRGHRGQGAEAHHHQVGRQGPVRRGQGHRHLHGGREEHRHLAGVRRRRHRPARLRARRRHARQRRGPEHRRLDRRRPGPALGDPGRDRSRRHGDLHLHDEGQARHRARLRRRDHQHGGDPVVLGRLHGRPRRGQRQPVA